MKIENRWDRDPQPVTNDGLLEIRPPLRRDGPQRAPMVLRHGDAYLIAEDCGDMIGSDHGLYLGDFCVLKRWRLSLGAREPVLLSSSVSHDNVVHTANLTSHQLPVVGAGPTLDDVVHLERKRLVCDGRFYEQLALSNFAARPVEVPVSIEFLAAADCQPVVLERSGEAAVGFTCTSPDGATRDVWVQFSEKPHTLSKQRATFMITLPGGGRHTLYSEVGSDATEPSRARFRAAAARAHVTMRSLRRRGTRLHSNARTFNEWIDKARSDLALLTHQLPTGPFPLGEIPQDPGRGRHAALVTALQTLWLDPALTRGVLRGLSREDLPVLAECPDVVPLFVTLAGAYAERTGDLYFIDEIWPSLTAATTWIESEGDADGDGLIDEETNGALSPFAEAGLVQTGRCARVELQGYCFRALTTMSALAERRHRFDAAARWQRSAERLRKAVEAAFWMPERNFYARAVDGSGQVCPARSTAAGHLLLAGLPSAARGRVVIDQLLSADFNTGWGLRSVARGEGGYNPLSWHSGSVWAHDTALCAAGMARYGERDGVVRLFGQMFDAAMRFDMRLPQLFCGFQRSAGEGPVAYPLVAQPQSWAASAPLLLLQACLGLRIDGYRGALHINRPRLPPDVDQLVLRGLLVGSRQIDLTYHRAGSGVVAYSDDFFDGSVPVLQHA